MSEPATVHATARRTGKTAMAGSATAEIEAMRNTHYQSVVASGKTRLINAFWSLLKTHHLTELTVGMIAKEAECNRGTFYYHYTDLDELVRNALSEEVQGERNLPITVFKLISDPQGTAGTVAASHVCDYMKRLCLLIEHGGRDLVDDHMKHVVIRIWETVLCADGSSLQPETRLLIEFYVSGVMGCLEHLSHESTDTAGAIDKLLLTVPPFILAQIASYQGLTEENLLLRLKLVALMSSAD